MLLMCKQLLANKFSRISYEGDMSIMCSLLVLLALSGQKNVVAVVAGLSTKCIQSNLPKNVETPILR